MPTRRQALAVAAALAVPLRPAVTQEQLRQVTIVVAFPAGGATDVAARLVADALRGPYAATAIIDNRTGAGGRIGTEFVKRAPADGSVLLYSPAFPLVIFPHVYRTLPYDTRRDFAAVALATRGMLALSVGPAVPESVRTVRELVTWCRANPDKAQFGAPSGSSQHFAGAMLGRAAGIDLTLVPYRGGAPVITDLIGGHVAIAVNPLVEALPHATGGKLRILAVTGARRSRFAPEVPTMAEAGFPDILFQDWSGVLAPAGTPSALRQRANELINALLRSDQGQAEFARLGTEPEPQGLDAFSTAITDDWQRYAGIVAATGFVAED